MFLDTTAVQMASLSLSIHLSSICCLYDPLHPISPFHLHLISSSVLHQLARSKAHSTAIDVYYTLVLAPLCSIDIFTFYTFHLSETLRSYLANRSSDRLAFWRSALSVCNTPSAPYSAPLRSFSIATHLALTPICSSAHACHHQVHQCWHQC